MSATSYTTLAGLVKDPASSGADLYAAAIGLRDSFVRSEHLIGLLPPDAPEVLVAGLRRAGDAGVVDAWLELGRLLTKGAAPWAPYPERDVDAAIEAYQAADRAGSAAGALGWIRAAYFARSTSHATAAATRLAELLAARPDDPDLLLLTGYLTHQGYGHPADPAAAVHHHLAAAEHGSGDAAFELSVLYGSGSGVPADQEESHRWTFRAAELDSARGMANLGGMYATGRGVEQDPAAAVRWYAKAAYRGHAKSAYTAGVMYLVGDGGLPVDEDEAESFFARAEELGFNVDDNLEAMGLSR
ncbi:sel1 repeat family protein [Lentzea tibetensis]|uniref:Sel1 repeat family protein n=1 Tax=Lentzea tibetensis TaxID=2591470 RepID=A0A563ENC7_9PSEU|nr:tetratricopeptide repeat protein [Lentzea tibetensis]TWP48500.1 sel1 repeat family protein [Lentzea tibetensis]